MISVILKGSPGQYYLDSKALLEYGFAHFINFNVAENETAYTEGESAVEVAGKSYLPADLKIDPSGAVTLPEGAVFADTEHLSLIHIFSRRMQMHEFYKGGGGIEHNTACCVAPYSLSGGTLSGKAV